ncbi:hypothetical protein Dimus_027565 [Dionaea muscipula]
MRRKWVCCCCLLVLALAMQIITWVSATSRHLTPPNHDHDHDHDHGPQKHDDGGSPDSSHAKITSEQGLKGIEGTEVKAKGSYKDEKMIGSRPPNCENKCYGCSPCEAIQVPTITSHFSIQYANYFPEGWKCKCGPSFYSP